MASMLRIPIALLLLQMTDAQQCCIWSGLANDESSSFSALEGMMAASSSAPTSSCAAPYTWTSCPRGCITITCTFTTLSASVTAYAGACAPNNEISASAIQELLKQSSSAVCTQKEGVIQEPPLTASTVTSAATAGSVGGQPHLPPQPS